MERNGISVLVGTVLVSLWLAPGARLTHDVAAQPPAKTSPGKNNPDDPGNTAERRERAHEQIWQQGKDEYRREIERVIRETCQVRDYQTDDEKKQEQQEQTEDRAASEKCRDPSNFVIALAPDPVHTHLALIFDRTVDVIEEAAQDEGYVFDRAVMPWDSKVHEEPSSYETRLAAEWYQRGKEDYPGIIAFRGDQNQQNQQNQQKQQKQQKQHMQPLFVLVVSETPTGGVRKRQFLHAIDVIQTASGKDLRTNWHPDGNRQPGLRILGPTFSGSLDSLSKLLKCKDKTTQQPGKCYPLVSIHSGSISSRDHIMSFDQDEDLQRFNVHFVSLHESDEVMIERFVQFMTGKQYEVPQQPFLRRMLCRFLRKGCKPELAERGYAAQEIAILSEDETAYGESGNTPPEPATPQEKNKGDSGQDRHSFSATEKERCEEERATQDQSCFLKLYFPREISQLRAAYQDSLAVPAKNDPNAPPRETLPSNYYVPGSNDTIAEYSYKQMPLSQESIMLDVVSELQRHKVKFIILRATDPMDALFLARFLRTEYPQGRVVTIDADLLFRREAEDPRLHGLLALSTYSLTPMANHNYHSFEDAHVERIFPSSNEAGTYNAMRSLLSAWVTDNTSSGSACAQDDDHPGRGCRHALGTHPQFGRSSGLRLYQYGWLYEWDPNNRSTDYDSPPVHVLALGRDDYWPIANLGPYSGEELVTTLPRVHDQMSGRVRRVRIPNSWRVVQLAGVLLGIAFSISIWRASVLAKTQSDAKFAPAALDPRATLVLLTGLTLVLILVILLWPTMKYADQGDVRLDIFLDFALIMVLFCTLVDLLNRAVLGQKGVRWHRGWVWPLLFLAGCLVLFSQIFWGQPEETPAFIVRFATLRATQLTSGLSFIMPTFFFLTVWLWWADHTAAGYAVLDHRRPRLPKGMMQPTVQGVSIKALPALRGALNLRPLSALGYALLLVVFYTVLWWMGSHPHPLLSLERPFLEACMSVFFTLAVGGIFLATVRLWEIWLGVRKLLVALDSLPLRQGFETIKGFSWKPIWRIGAGSLQEFQRIFHREKEALDCALKTYPLEAGNLESEWNDTLSCAGRVKLLEHPYTLDWWRHREAERELIRQFGKYQAQVAKVTGRALDLLARRWAEHKEEKKLLVDTDTTYELGMRAWERCVCMVYVNFLLVMLVRIRTLIVAIGGMYVLTLIGITQYPFEPKATVQILLIVLLAFVVVVVGLVFSQIHRDAILSYITDTKPGELGSDFWFRMVSFTALPLFSLLASQFPSVNRFFYSWLQPAIQALNR